MASESIEEKYSDDQIESMVYAIWHEEWDYDEILDSEQSYMEIDDSAVDDLIRYIKEIRDIASLVGEAKKGY